MVSTAAATDHANDIIRIGRRNTAESGGMLLSHPSRAGRTAPGHCLRLWTEREHLERAPQELPEVKRLDLAEVVLTLKASATVGGRLRHDVDRFVYRVSPR